MKNRLLKKSGMSLAEVMVAATIFIIAATGILLTLLKCMELEELGRNSQQALAGIQTEIDVIKNADFSTIEATYNNATFTHAALTGMGKVYVDNTDPNLLIIKVVYCWRQSNRRVIGEDTNLNGTLDAGEDKNGNGQIDSYVQVQTQIFG